MAGKLIDGNDVIEFLRKFRGAHKKKDTEKFARRKKYDPLDFEYCVSMFMFDQWHLCDARDTSICIDPSVNSWSKLKWLLRDERRVSETRKKEDEAVERQESFRATRSQIGTIPGISLARIMAEQDCICPCCKRDMISFNLYHLDHIMPLSKGGPDEYWNLQFLCGPCNLVKSDKEPISWAKHTGAVLPEKFLSVYLRRPT